MVKGRSKKNPIKFVLRIAWAKRTFDKYPSAIIWQQVNTVKIPITQKSKNNYGTSTTK